MIWLSVRQNVRRRLMILSTSQARYLSIGSYAHHGEVFMAEASLTIELVHVHPLYELGFSLTPADD